MRILIVPERASAGRELRKLLEERCFAVAVADDGEAALDRLLQGGYDLALIDADPPKRAGLQVVKGARDAKIVTFIVMIDSDGSAHRRVAGLEAGADDYIVKPFAEIELVARLNALARRALVRPERRLVQVGALCIDASGHYATYGGRALQLSRTEFRVLQCLAFHSAQVFTRERLLQRAWQRDFALPTNAVDVCVGSLRRKLAEAGATRPIRTVRGLGYTLGIDSRIP